MNKTITTVTDCEQQDLIAIFEQEKQLVTPSDFLYLIGEYDKYILKYPDVLTAYVNRANLLQKLGLYHLALRDVEYAIFRKNDFALAWCHRAFILNLLGNYAEGWRDFEWRLKERVRDSHAESWGIPRWSGQDIGSKKLLLLAEQGLGDNIQFIRYAIDAKQRGMNIVVINRHPLDNLLTYTLEKHGIEVATVKPVDNVFYYVYMMSMPHYFHTTLENIPLAEGYLEAEPSYKSKWQNLLGDTKRKKIGIVWGGSFQHNRNKARSIDFELISQLFELDADFHCLQKEVSVEDLEKGNNISNLYFWHDKLSDFSDTAGLIDQLDLVISVDTSVAHLAGAMAKPTWIMITHNPDYRWLLGRDDSPWYKSVRLFRQGSDMTWKSTIPSIKESLAKFIAK